MKSIASVAFHDSPPRINNKPKLVLQLHGARVVAVFRGVGGLLTTEKSAALLFVSVQLAVLLAALVALKTAVPDVSEQLADP
jgi:hypothetical protein